MIKNHHFALTYRDSVTLLNHDSLQIAQPNENKSHFLLYHNNLEIGQYKPPYLLLQLLKTYQNSETFIKTKLDETPPSYFIILIEAGRAALGFSVLGKIEKHKNFSRYMVRKTQGKLQLTHLKTKGKSRLGSRIRLQQSVKFFEEINEKLLSWEINKLNNAFIFYDCTKTLWPFLLDANNAAFNKSDVRLNKIPFNIPAPELKTLEYCNKLLQKGIITFNTEKTAEAFFDIWNVR